MPAVVQEWLNLLVRWVHVIAGIMWVGDSFLFVWLDTHLGAPTRAREGDVQGELWLTHSGGFYEVVKRRSLTRGELPPTLYWFKWEAYATWLTGLLLLVVVYGLNRAALLVDPNTLALTPAEAIWVSVGLLPLGYGVYELLWLTPLAKSQRAFAAAGPLLVLGLAWGLLQIFSARGAFLQLGAMIGTVMAANVFFRIIPAQKHLLAMARAGQKVDPRWGLRARLRSVQNHYLTLPVLFCMLSNHFPSMYGSARPHLVLALVFAFGVGVKHFMSRRLETPPLALAGTALALGGVLFLTRPVSEADAAAVAWKGRPKVSYATVQAIVEARCTSCHSARPTSPMFAAPPLGVVLTSPQAVGAHAERVFLRAVATRTMPLGNMTGMTDDERALLGAWFAQGADLEAGGPPQVTLPDAAPGSEAPPR